MGSKQEIVSRLLSGDGHAVFKYDTDTEICDVIKEIKTDLWVKTHFMVKDGIWNGYQQPITYYVNNIEKTFHKTRVSLKGTVLISYGCPDIDDTVTERLRVLLKAKISESPYSEFLNPDLRPAEARDYYREAIRNRPDNHGGNCATLHTIEIPHLLPHKPSYLAFNHPLPIGERCRTCECAKKSYILSVNMVGPDDPIAGFKFELSVSEHEIKAERSD